MPETASAVVSYFSAGEGVAATAAAAEGTAAAGATTTAAGTATAAGGSAAAGSGAAAAGTGATAAGTAASGVGSVLSNVGNAVLSSALSAGVSSLLAPGRPDLPQPIAMPDAMAQEEARKRAIIEQTSRRGRASTVLTDSAAGTLGG